MASLSQTKRDKVFKKTNGRCFYCSTKLHRECDMRTYEEYGKISFDCFSQGKCFQVDHLTPKSQDGSNKLKNLVPSCQKCNAVKGLKNIFEFLEKSRKQKNTLEKRIGLVDKRIRNILNHIEYIYE